MANTSDLEYYRSLPDYEEIEEYLDLTPVEVAMDESALPKFNPDYSSAIIVDNLPKIPPEKVPRLIAVFLKLYTQVSSTLTADDIYMPIDESKNLTYGFCFIQLASGGDAEKAIKATQGFQLDKNHAFKVSPYSDLSKYAKISEDDQPPALTDFHPKPEIASWLNDEKCRDQFAVRHGRETEIYWANASGEEPSLVYGGEREKKTGKLWCELNVEWSPQGTYFVTFHKPGVKLWGSGEFNALGRFMHPNVEEISFSPCENYLVTYRFSDLPATSKDSKEAKEAIIVWDVRTGRKLKTFELKNPLDVGCHVQAKISEEKSGKTAEKLVRCKVKSYEVVGKIGYFTLEVGHNQQERVSQDKVEAVQDPNRLKWSADGKYLARLGTDIISIYELPTMNLLGSKSHAAKDSVDFCWSPKGSLLAHWAPAVGNHPASINIVRFPDRAEISSRNLFDVTDGKMVWQNEGEYLCVHMTKLANKKKTYVLMFFHVNINNVPVVQVEVPEPILNVAWEPSGNRVAILYGEQRTPTITVYASTTTTAKAAASSKLEMTQLFVRSCSQCNSVQWSPAGGVIALAYFASDSCPFELLDVDNNVILANRRHDRCTKLLWDPSGRYLASCTITDLRNVNVKGNPDDGVNFYTFQGILVHQMKREKLYSFAWRPRPKDLLSNEERKKIIKNIRKYEKAFEKEDRARKDEITQELQANRYRIAKEFLEWMHANQAKSAELKPLRVQLRDGYDSDDERNYDIEVVSA
eukprot:gene5554-6116_t